LRQRAAMHELREDAAAGRMDGIDDAAPGIRLLPVGQAGLARIGLRIGLVGVDAFGRHQAEAAACEALDSSAPCVRRAHRRARR
jgi:hypothetical protein